MRTIIAGQARSGTTALYLRLQAGAATETVCLFEPPALPPGDLASTLLVKTLVMSLPDDLHCPPLDPARFDRRLVCVRDPRDRLVSVLVFLLQWHSPTYLPLWQQCPAGLEAVVHLLRQKEHEPASVTVQHLFETILWLRFGLDRWQAPQMWARLQAGFLQWATTFPHETIRYEGLVTRVPVPPIPRHLASILRTATTGEWRQWFTPDDCAYFRPLLLPYLQRYQYPDAWDLPRYQWIDPAGSSQYVLKWVRVQRRASHAAATP